MAQEFKVSERQAQDWRKAVLDLVKMPRVKKACRRAIFPQKERDLKDWICDHRQQGYVVTCGAIRMKAKQKINNELFHASAGWCTHSFHAP